MRHAFSAIALLIAAAAAPAPDPLQQQLIADAKATKPVAFERTHRVEDNGKPTTYVDRYDPALVQPWRLVSVDGRAPKADELGNWRQSVKNGAPAYARVAMLLPAAHRIDATHYRVDHLPKGFMSPGILAEHLIADLTIDMSGGRPFVRESRFYATGPFRMMLIAKVDKFDASSRYAIDASGIPRIVTQDVVIAGSGPGMSGTQVNHATFAPIRN